MADTFSADRDFRAVHATSPRLNIGPAQVPGGRSIMRRWMTAAGIPWRKDAIETTKPVETLDQLKGVLRYMCKSLEEATWREHLRIEDRGPQGLVIGKRRGCSQNIGATARARHHQALRAKAIALLSGASEAGLLDRTDLAA